MGQLPTGTVTLLFSDIEGSTLLLNRLGALWADALSAQRSILRSVFAAHGGHEMGTEGDSFFVVFSSAHAALAAAMEGQHRLQAHSWPEHVPLRVRIGLHTGEPQRHEDGYIGLDVHRAARIAATASGGQVVLSEATKLMLSDLDGDIVIRDLGWHRLKDFEETEHLFDVVDARGNGLSEFPPLKSLGARANLPVPATPLIGRAGELQEMISLFEEDRTRLVTLTGPGGSGKTRLALSVAAAFEHLFPHGIFFAELHTVDREPLMWAGIAEAVGASGDVEEMPQERVWRLLADRRALLVLDNLEQIHHADHVVDQLLSHAPHVSVLATSRRPLHLVREHEHHVPPLELPRQGQRTVESAAQSGAVELFVRRATMSNPHFALTDDNVADVVELCRKLDGLPLAIELAAARSRLLTPRAMLGRIDERLGLGVTAADRAPRQRSLGDTIAWSYDLLQSADQQVFRRLGVFSSSCDLAAVESVSGVPGTDSFDMVARLFDASLLQIADSPDGEPRVSMLETIRSFARDRLDASGEAADIHLRHARWAWGVAVEIVGHLGGAMQVAALDHLTMVEEDIRAALDWCLRPGDEHRKARTEAGLQLLSAMTTYWYRFGYLTEGQGWFERGVAVSGAVESKGVVDALHGMGIMMVQQSEVDPAVQAFERALHMARRLGDRDLEAREANSLGVAHREAGDLAEGRQLVELSLAVAREVGSSRREATALSNLVTMLVDSGEYAEAVLVAREAITADQARDDRWGMAINNTNLAMALLLSDGPAPAYDSLAETAVESVAIEDIELSIAIVEIFASVMSALGEANLAARLMGTADTQREVVGIPRSRPDTVLLDRSLAPAKQQLSPTEWDRAHFGGRQLTIDQAVAEALGVRD